MYMCLQLSNGAALMGIGLTQGELFPYLPSEVLSGFIAMKNISLMSGITKHDGMSMGAGMFENDDHFAFACG